MLEIEIPQTMQAIIIDLINKRRESGLKNDKFAQLIFTINQLAQVRRCMRAFRPDLKKRQNSFTLREFNSH